MKKIIFLALTILLSLSMCACSFENTNSNTSVDEIAVAKAVLDKDCEEYLESITKTQLVYSRKIDNRYDRYKYFIYIGNEHTTEYKLIYDILKGIHNGVDVGDTWGIIESIVICNNEEYTINKKTYMLNKSSDTSWSWSQNGETEKDRYSTLTNSEKKAICNYIQERYDYYDSVNGGYAGDKYSDTIMREVAIKYGITEQQAFIIWSNYYSY